MDADGVTDSIPGAILTVCSVEEEDPVESFLEGEI